ncbi:uncharacterized protein FIBRA_05719 [Fibroporia radiculosa]|uniref:Uncharacterized protein n=1 Tax=Fibroporia radiculosa TaxID=599839 RepID=J4HY04_9APHY|nr:uncharacterized protein FIBRA_05719 [Fibroporia radiculosa]CCM03582.1 predicted protein [Fibroporia radiculosa]
MITPDIVPPQPPPPPPPPPPRPPPVAAVSQRPARHPTKSQVRHQESTPYLPLSICPPPSDVSNVRQRLFPPRLQQSACQSHTFPPSSSIIPCSGPPKRYTPKLLLVSPTSSIPLLADTCERAPAPSRSRQHHSMRTAPTNALDKSNPSATPTSTPSGISATAPSDPHRTASHPRPACPPTSMRWGTSPSPTQFLMRHTLPAVICPGRLVSPSPRRPFGGHSADTNR